MKTVRENTQWMVRDQVITNYLSACKEASENEEKFNQFKTDDRYTAILEHVSKKIADSYFKSVLENNAELINNKSFYDNDNFGSPILNLFNSGRVHARCSNSTMQYIGVLSNLIKEFGSLDNMSMVEIGGGYGGQCVIIQGVFDIKSYTIIDLLEPTLLQKKYLSKFKENKSETATVEGLPIKEYDLVISNYALTEILEPLQTEYVKNILLNSKHGYITCNGNINAVDLIKEKFSTFKISNDIEGEKESNYIITW